MLQNGNSHHPSSVALLAVADEIRSLTCSLPLQVSAVVHCVPFGFLLDPQELFVPTENYYEVIQMRTNHPTLLPCQVTDPRAKVTLHREFPPEKVPVDGINISYNVKRGFTIHRPHPSYAGSLYCMANMNRVRQISTKYMLIYVNCKLS